MTSDHLKNANYEATNLKQRLAKKGSSGIMTGLRISERITGPNNRMVETVFVLNRSLHTATCSSLPNSHGFLAREFPSFRRLTDLRSESVDLGLLFG